MLRPRRVHSHCCEDLKFSEFRIFDNKESSDSCRSSDISVVATCRRLVRWLSEAPGTVQGSSLLHMFTEEGVPSSVGLHTIFLSVQ
jgi:hypothetical protein